MNPCDALTKDYGMYYDGCWMRHTKHGIGRIRVVGGTMYLETTPGMADPIKVGPKYLSCWWPRPGAFNIKGHAVYIARRAIRNMRKSAVGQDHYFVKWGSPYGHDLMLALRDGPNLVGLYPAMTMIRENQRDSVAVSRDVILYKDDVPDQYLVIFRGMESGTYTNGHYEPSFSDSPLTGRILRQLEAR